MNMIMMIYGDSNDIDVLMYVSNDHNYDGDNVNASLSVQFGFLLLVASCGNCLDVPQESHVCTGMICDCMLHF